MKDNNNRKEEQLVLKTEQHIRTHLTSGDVVDSVLSFGAVTDTMDIGRTRTQKQKNTDITEGKQ